LIQEARKHMSDFRFGWSNGTRDLCERLVAELEARP